MMCSDFDDDDTPVQLEKIEEKKDVDTPTRQRLIPHGNMTDTPKKKKVEVDKKSSQISIQSHKIAYRVRW